MAATVTYRVLIAIRGCWLMVEWFFGWGPHSRVSSFTLIHPYASLVAGGIAVAFWLIMLVGMWFFQGWARWTFVILLAVTLLTSPFRVQRYSLSSPPSIVAPVGVFMLLLTAAIV